MMKAVVYYKNGGPDVFEYKDVDIPTEGSNEVLIKNEYISIEGGDLVAREIMPPERVPHVVGYQCAGEIVEVGAEVRIRSIGQKVVTLVPSGSHSAWGSHAEYTVAAADMTWVVPANMSLDIASAIPVVFGAAHECLFEFGHLKQGQSVLVHAGALVFTTASDDSKLARLKREFGADVAINYVKQDFVAAINAETNGKGVNLVVDGVAGGNLTRSIASLKYRGRAIMIGVSGRDPEQLNPLALWANSTNVQGVYYPGIFPQEHDCCFAVVSDLIDDVAKGGLKVPIDRVFSLAEAAAAHRFILERRAFGRVLLKA